MTGTEWDVESIASVTDGDTLRVYRSRIVQLGDENYRITDVKSKPLRLAWVDTPERGQHPGWENARTDLMHWLEAHPTGLRVICYESAGWDRLLADLVAVDGSNASQWLMTSGNNGKGWPAYVKGQ